MEKTEALRKFTELYQASETQDPGRCAEEVIERLLRTAQQDCKNDPDKMLESVEAFQLISALAFDETYEEETSSHGNE
jgi:hypothetical protein